MYLDTTISIWVYENITSKYDFLGQISKILSQITSWGQLWIVLMIFLVVYEIIKTKKVNMYLLLTLVPILLGWVLSEFGIKNWIGRERPYTQIEVLAEYVKLIGYKMSSGNSFPSGHTLIAFAAAFVLINYNKKYGIWAYPLAVLIAFSRIVLGAHYLSDVIAGAGLGTAFGSLGVLMANKLSNKVNEWINSKITKEKVDEIR